MQHQHLARRSALALGLLAFFLSYARLTAADSTPPVIVSLNPQPGTVNDHLEQITVTFSEPVTGVDIDDLLINDLPMIGVSGADATYTFTTLQPAFGPVRISWAANHAITDLADPANAFDAGAPGATWLYDFVDTEPPVVQKLFPAAGATVRSLSQLEVNFSENVQGVAAADLLINGQPAVALIAFPEGRYIFQFLPPAPGTVNLTWASNHGITDFAPAPHPFAGGAWTVQLDPNAQSGDLIINEILASNENGLVDEDSTPQDWIEIFNRGTNVVNLAGWSLSDDSDVPGLWVFPSKTLAPGQYLVVFASGKDRKAPTGTHRFHTNFKLSGVGEHLGLYTPDSPRVLAHGFDPKFPEQRNDFSYGYDAGGNLRYFATPSPGAANGNSTITGICEPVHFSASRGHYQSPFNLYLSSPTPNASIRYTTNGAEPTTTTGLAYTGPLRIATNAVIRAVAYKSGVLPSTILTHTYLFNQNPATRSLPVISIVTAQNNITGPTGIYGIGSGYDNPNLHGIAWERPTSVEFIRPEDNSGFQINCGIRVHGSDYTRPRYTGDGTGVGKASGTANWAYRLYFRGDYGPGRLEYPFFADSVLQSFDQLVLRAGHNDEANPFLTDELARKLSLDMGQVSCHGNFVHLFVNGVWKGYYNSTERVEDAFIQSYQGGSDQWDVLTVGSAVQSGDNIAWNGLLNLVTDPNVNIQLPAVYQEIGRRLDVTNFVDYLFLNIYGATWDWPHNNWRAARERTTNGLFRFYVWDAEGAFGVAGGKVPSGDYFTTSDSGLGSTAEIGSLYNRLRTNPEFRLLFADRIHKHWFNNGALVETNISSRFIQLRADLLASISGFNNSILTSWIPQRRAPLNGQLITYKLIASSNAPVLNQFGGRVPRNFNLTMTTKATNGTIYYTLNGSDPRVMFTDAVAPGAAAYAGPITLTENVALRARTLQGTTNWSALTTTTFEVGTRGVPVRITELMYNPVGGTPYEFIELQNIGTTTLDLAGMSFEGVVFNFPVGSSLAAGARLVIGSDQDPTAFAARYPGIAVAGRFSGSLNNGGEKIALKDRNGFVIVSVDYKDSGGWPTAADGSGYSLEIIDPLGDPDAPANWRASTQLNGTPGAPPAALPVPGVRLNEVMAENLSTVINAGTYPDWIELFNSTGTTVDLGGWSLTDDGTARKYVFPSNTPIAAGDYLVVWCDSITNTSPGLHTGFSLGQNGESVFLYDANTNRVDALTFGVQLADYSVGQIAGVWQLNTPTLGAANLAAITASPTNLVVNEWLANPLSGPDWLELYNPADQPVALRGIYLGTSNALQQLTPLSFIAAHGYQLFFADEGVGADHLDFKLPSTPNAIFLYDDAAQPVQRVAYGTQLPGLTQGRLPDGNTNLVSFPGTPSPGTTNYTAAYTGPVLNELMARNRTAVTNSLGQVSDWLELFNPAAGAFDVSGMSLSLDEITPGQWVFPAGTTIPANGNLVLWCEGSQPASTNTGTYLNTGRSLDGSSGGVYLFNLAGQLVDSVEYGFQIDDLAIGRVAGKWRLLDTPTPGAANAGAATLGAATALRLNEWMARPWNGDDWFELFNGTNQPVALGGLFLSDDASSAGTNQYPIPALSFIPAGGWVKFVADGNAIGRRDHVSFVLSGDGESLRLYHTNATLIDAVYFGSQLAGVSEGRLPDGTTNTVRFPGAATPGESNYQLLPDVVINELLTDATFNAEDAIELFNPTAAAVNLGGWYLSDRSDALKKFRIPDGTVLAPGGFAVFYEFQFNDGSPAAFSLSGTLGGEVWLSAADVSGNLTGHRARAPFGAALDRLSFGPYTTALGVDYVALTSRTFGADASATLAGFRTGTGKTNSPVKIGPVVISEIMYHPPAGASPSVEFIELHNLSNGPVPLWAANYPANTWQLREAVEFTFPLSTTIAAGARVLVVDFDPAGDPATLATFRAAYGIPAGVPVFGPFHGKLDNNGDDVALYSPTFPHAPDTFVPYALVERVKYAASAPWPTGADGGGLSLQRRSDNAYGNDPENWIADLPTPGLANRSGVQLPPVITLAPASQMGLVDRSVIFTVAASGDGPLNYQWRKEGQNLPGATTNMLTLTELTLDQAGHYDVFVANAGGSTFSTVATLVVNQAPSILQSPVSQTVKGGTNVTFSVLAVGSPVLNYQWRLNGVIIPGANATALFLTNVGLAHVGNYTVTVTNGVGDASASADLLVLVAPVYTQQPQPVTAVQGDTVTFSATATGTLPMTFKWRRNGAVVTNNPPGTNIISTASSSTITLNNVQVNVAGSYTALITNLASAGALSVATSLTVLTDADGDHVPDVWMMQYFGHTNGLAADFSRPTDDADSDGFNNLQEYQAGTDPNDAASHLKWKDIVATPDTTALTFDAVSNRTYSVLYKHALTNVAWLRLTNVPARITNRLETVADRGPFGVARFYRLLTPAQP